MQVATSLQFTKSTANLQLSTWQARSHSQLRQRTPTGTTIHPARVPKLTVWVGDHPWQVAVAHPQCFALGQRLHAQQVIKIALVRSLVTQCPQHALGSVCLFHLQHAALQGSSSSSQHTTLRTQDCCQGASAYCASNPLKACYAELIQVRLVMQYAMVPQAASNIAVQQTTCKRAGAHHACHLRDRVLLGLRHEEDLLSDVWVAAGCQVTPLHLAVEVPLCSHQPTQLCMHNTRHQHTSLIGCTMYDRLIGCIGSTVDRLHRLISSKQDTTNANNTVSTCAATSTVLELSAQLRKQPSKQHSKCCRTRRGGVGPNSHASLVRALGTSWHKAFGEVH